MKNEVIRFVISSYSLEELSKIESVIKSKYPDAIISEVRRNTRPPLIDGYHIVIVVYEDIEIQGGRYPK